MNELVKKELEKNMKVINENLRIILEGKFPNAELIKMEFDSIRILIEDNNLHKENLEYKATMKNIVDIMFDGLVIK